MKKSRASRRVSLMNPGSRKSHGSVKSHAKSKLGKSILTKHSRLNVSSSKKIGAGLDERRSTSQYMGSRHLKSSEIDPSRSMFMKTKRTFKKKAKKQLENSVILNQADTVKQNP
jgi:hypothetical protein